MGTFIGHLLPGSLFLVVGLWHTWCSVYRYATTPTTFRFRVWNPAPGKIKYLELYVIVIGTFIDLCSELLYSPHPNYFINGVLDSAHLYCFEHSGMLLMFFLFSLFSLISVKTSYLPMPEGALSLLMATAFSTEFLLFHFHSTNRTGLEGYYHFILLLLIGLCVLTTILGALVPSSFPVDLSFSMGLTLQGLWFYQTAFTLFGPMMPDGCELIGSDIICRSSDSQIRGEFLANFQLFSLVTAVFIMIAVLYSYATSKLGISDQEGLRTTDAVQ